MEFLMTAALFAARLIEVYSFLIWIRIFISWFNPYPRPGSMTYYLAMVIDPYLNLFRSSRYTIGMFDFSPIIGVGILSIFQSIFTVFGQFGTITFGLILAFVLSAFWSYGVSLMIWVAGFSAVIRIISMLMHSYAPMSDPFQRLSNMIRGSFPRMSEMGVAIIELIIIVLLYFVMKNIFGILITLAARIPF